jgi:hypothetical protein
MGMDARNQRICPSIHIRRRLQSSEMDGTRRHRCSCIRSENHTSGVRSCKRLVHIHARIQNVWTGKREMDLHMHDRQLVQLLHSVQDIFKLHGDEYNGCRSVLLAAGFQDTLTKVISLTQPTTSFTRVRCIGMYNTPNQRNRMDHSRRAACYHQSEADCRYRINRYVSRVHQRL